MQSMDSPELGQTGEFRSGIFSGAELFEISGRRSSINN